MMNREIELLDKKRVWKDYREMTSSERSRYFDTGMTVEYSNGKTTVIHCYGNEHLEGMRNGTLRMGVYAPEEMVLVPKSVVKELIDTHDQIIQGLINSQQAKYEVSQYIYKDSACPYPINSLQCSQPPYAYIKTYLKRVS